MLINAELRSADTETEGQCRLLSEGIEEVIYTVGGRTIREGYGLFDGGLRKKKKKNMDV